MTTINQELYEARKEAGASEDAAKRTASGRARRAPPIRMAQCASTIRLCEPVWYSR